jgi:beta-galactosidase
MKVLHWSFALLVGMPCAAACGTDDGARPSPDASTPFGGSAGSAGQSASAGKGGALINAGGSGTAGSISAGASGVAGNGTGGLASGGGAGTGGGGGGTSGGGNGGQAGASPAPAPNGNSYDGARPTTLSFDSGWKFHLGDVNGAQGPTFDDASWTALDVPHDWSISLPFNQSSASGAGGGYLDGGVGWYRKTFTLPQSSSGQKVFVQFDGVYMDSTVWLNGTQVCARPYGYSSFECDLTANAKLGASNVLAVKVNNQLPSSRWYSGSGIYRRVWLKTVNPLRVAYTGTRVTASQISTTSATVNVTVSVQNDTSMDQSVIVASSVRDAAGNEVATATAAAKTVSATKAADVTESVNVPNPRLWSTTAPTLYSVVTTVSANGAVVDTYATSFGIRSFAFDANTGFSLNGHGMKINGVCLHHDLGSLGAAVNHRAIEKRLQLLKDMGANAIRTSHNPPAPELLELADRLGFLVMDEAFDMWYASKTEHDYARFFRQWASTDIGDMVSRDRNHPSIIIWSIGNEIPQAGDQTVAKQLIAAVKAKDDTRVIGQALAAWAFDEGTAGLEDVVGINYAPDRYDSLHQSHPNWKLLASESSSAFRSRGLYRSGNNQSSSYDDSVAGWGTSAERSWTDVNSRAWVAGEFIWTGIDYIGEPTPYEWPSKSSYFGAIDTANFPKDIFYFYQSRWNYGGPAMVHIVPMDWTNWTSGQSVRVLAYSNADSVELFLNGKSLGSKNVDPVAGHPNSGHLEWSVPFATGTLEAKATKGGSVVANDKVQTAGAAASLALQVDRASIASDGRDLAFVEVDVVDAQGVLVPRANNKIDFAVDGPGTLVGVDNGDATNHESYKEHSRSAFTGKALAIIQSTTTPGTVTVKATSGSLKAGSVAITTGP